MTDLEISKALALAIGWNAADIICNYKGQLICFDGPALTGVFDYRDWAVIGPIAERHNCFPQKGSDIFGGEYWWSCTDDLGEAYADTPQKAIALAVIEANK